MKYYLVHSGIIEPELEKYVVKQNETKDVCLISFDDKDVSVIADSIGDFLCIDEHRKYYKYENGELIPANDKFDWSPQMWYKRFCRIYKNLHKEEISVLQKLKSSGKTLIEKYGFGIGKFKSYKFVDKDNELVCPFRFKGSKGKEKQPLVIFFCGADAVGTDNLKPFISGIPMIAKLNKYNCNILIPQPLTSINYNKSYEDLNSKFDRYINSVYRLVSLLKEKENIDEKRIYAFGTSLGGCCVWRLVYNYPQLCACAVPVVGRFDLKTDNPVYTDFERIAHLPVWVAHSSNDKMVGVEYDDFAVSKLKELGSDVKYTRWDKYGHGMASVFYRKEKWDRWMFEQSQK